MSIHSCYKHTVQIQINFSSIHSFGIWHSTILIKELDSPQTPKERVKLILKNMPPFQVKNVTEKKISTCLLPEKVQSKQERAISMPGDTHGHNTVRQSIF